MPKVIPREGTKGENILASLETIAQEEGFETKRVNSEEPGNVRLLAGWYKPDGLFGSWFLWLRKLLFPPNFEFKVELAPGDEYSEVDMYFFERASSIIRSYIGSDVRTAYQTGYFLGRANEIKFRRLEQLLHDRLGYTMDHNCAPIQ